MHILVHLHDPAEQAALCALLQTWATFSCVSLQIVTQEPADCPGPAILFWDLDGPAPPVLQRPDCALILCSRDPRQAIGSYCFHPAGFLTKPITADCLWAVMNRCAGLWYDALQRLEVLNGRDKFPLPIHDLVWAEGVRRGCLLHQAGRGGAHAGREIIQRKGSQCVGNICCALWGGIGRNNAQNMGICRVQNGNLFF